MQIIAAMQSFPEETTKAIRYRISVGTYIHTYIGEYPFLISVGMSKISLKGLFPTHPNLKP